MALILLYATERGVRRLLDQPADIAERLPRRLRMDEAYPPYLDLFTQYRADLAAVYEIAAPWWADTVQAQVHQGLGRDEAIRAAFNLRVAGAASHPNVVWVVRSYWLECDSIDRRVPIERRVFPETLLLQWLIDAGEDELVRLLACMPYWPVGVDADGNWC